MATNPFAKFGPRQPVNPFARFGPRQPPTAAASTSSTLPVDDVVGNLEALPATFERGVEDFAKGGGSALQNTARGLAQIFHLPQRFTPAAAKAPDDLAGTLGKFTGYGAEATGAAFALPEVAPALVAAGLAPETAAAVAPYVSSAIVGGALNAAQPDQSVKQRLVSGAEGAAIGAAGEGLAPVLGKIAEAAKPAYTAAKRAAIDLMHDIDVPVRLQNVVEGRFGQMAANAVSRDVPGSGGPRVERKVLRNFTAAVAREAGMDTHEITPKVLADNADRIDADYNRLFAHTHASLTLENRHVLGQLVQDADDLGSAQAGKAAQRLVGRLEQQLSNHGGDLPGRAWESFQRDDLRKALNSTDASVRSMARSLRKVVLGAFERDNGPEDAAQFRALNDQFKSQATIEDALRKGGRIGRQGYIDPATLANAIKPKFGATPRMQQLADAGVILFKPTANTTLPERVLAFGALGGLSGLDVILDPAHLATKAAAAGSAYGSALAAGQVINRISGDALTNATSRALARLARAQIARQAGKELPAVLAAHREAQAVAALNRR